MEKPRVFQWQIWILAVGFILSLAVIVIFTIRSLHAAPRRHMAEPIRPWMSVPYIAHSYQVPAGVLYQALGLPDDRRDRRPIAVIARDQHRTVESVMQALYQAIVQAHPTIMPPTPEPLDPTGSAP